MSMHYQPNVFLYITRLNDIILDLESILRSGNKAKVQLFQIVQLYWDTSLKALMWENEI